MQVAEEVESVVERDDDAVAAGGESCAVGERACAGAGRVAAAMDVDEDGSLCAGPMFGRPDIQDEAVFGLRLAA